ncbi:hypothetical protein GCM10007880_61340 [Mesorhizobium amorphae]|nr:hypothetical protein GCM10007880_61340 [Mesorhizobium amorphae]
MRDHKKAKRTEKSRPPARLIARADVPLVLRFSNVTVLAFPESAYLRIPEFCGDPA